MRYTQNQKITVFILVFTAAIPVYANTGFPMIFHSLPWMLFALVPLILIESYIVSKFLGIGFEKALNVMAAANLLTTLIGLPLTNILGYFLANFFWITGVTDPDTRTFMKATIGFSWFDPARWTRNEEGRLILPSPREPGWYFFLALGFSFLVNYIASWYFEYLYMKKSFDSQVTKVRKAAILCNACSYAVIALVLTLMSLSDM